MENERIKDELCDICHRMWQNGWVAANDGNVSIRLDNDIILCTPSGVSKRDVTPEILVYVNMQGCLVEGNRKVSTELPMHLRCYQKRPDIRAVVHAHPPMATTFAVANKPLNDYAMIETILTFGTVPIAPYAVPGTDQVPDSIAPLITNHDAVLLRAHGALTLGRDLITAYYRMETLEQFARITLYSKLLGGAEELTRPQVEELIERRTNFYKMPGVHPGYEK